MDFVQEEKKQPHSRHLYEHTDEAASQGRREEKGLKSMGRIMQKKLSSIQEEQHSIIISENQQEDSS